MLSLSSETELYDIAIVGCGPAGLSAAINATVRRKNIIVFGTEVCSPKLQKSPVVDNYLGFISIPGDELRERFIEHARKMGVTITKGRVDSIYPDGDAFTLVVKSDFYRARSVVLAMGVAHARYLPGEQELLGRGVSYCATCDGPFFGGKTVAVLGYSADAEEEAEYLAGVAGKVYYIPLYPNPRITDERIQVLAGRKPTSIQGGNGGVTGLVLRGVGSAGKDGGTGQDGAEVLAVDGVFVEREVTPTEKLLAELELADSAVKVDHEMKTSMPGVFAAGDCTGKPYQLAKAVGEGQVAALKAVSYVDALRRKGEYRVEAVASRS